MTTVVCVRRGEQVCMGGDGQVSVGCTIMKGNAKKVRRLRKGTVLAGFAGGTADAITLFEQFEKQLELHQGLLVRAGVELAKFWRTSRDFKRLEAVLVVADKKSSLMITGNGDVIQPENDLIAVGSGGVYARAAVEAMLLHTSLTATEMVNSALEIAGRICIYTNQNKTIETLDATA